MGTRLLAFAGENLQVTLFCAGELFCVIELVLRVQSNLDGLSEFYLIFRAEQRGLADAVEINADEVCRRIIVGLVAARSAVYFLFFISSGT